jgi:hypothetical protein
MVDGGWWMARARARGAVRTRRPLDAVSFPAGNGLMSRRDSVSQPGVARNELPRDSAWGIPTPKALRKSGSRR